MRPLLVLFALTINLNFAHADPAADARQLLEQLVAIDTTNPPGREAEAAKAIAERLRAAGVSSEIVPFGPGRASVVARLRGDGSKKPLLLIAHLDVVGAAEQPWTVKPFQLTERAGFLYGRGVLDDKGWAAIATAVFLELARTHEKLHRDVILALTGDEESGGAGVRYILEHRPELLADAEFALNEGGSTLLDANGKVKLVAIQTAEKTYQNFSLTAHGTGGHASVPNDDSAIYHLARALTKLEALRFPPRLTPTVRSNLRGNAALESGPVAAALRTAADAKDEIPPDALALIDRSIGLRALTRTTCAATLLSGGTRENALPVEARATVNCRLVPVDSIDLVKKQLEDAIGDPRVAVAIVPDVGAGPEVPVEGPVKEAVTKVARALYGAEVTVAASLGTGASDSRFLRARGMGAYGLGLLPVTPADAHRPHGPDERAPVSSLPLGVKLLSGVVRALAE